MFESAELGHKIDKKTYAAEVPKLREALLQAQFELSKQGSFQVLIIVGGLDGAGREETVNLLNEWMDPRFIQTHAMSDPSDEEQERPAMWRFWRALPPKGRIGVFLGSWYTWLILDRSKGRIRDDDFVHGLERAHRFENMLVEEGALIIKFWLHLSRKNQKARLAALEKDPSTRWRVTRRDWSHYRKYEKLRVIHESVIRHTSTAEAPWLVVEGTDARYRNLTVGNLLLQALNKRLEAPTTGNKDIHVPPLPPPLDNLDLLQSLDLGQKIGKRNYEKQLAAYQGQLALLTRNRHFSRLAVVVVFEGNDAAGKGGAIRRVTGGMDARSYNIVPVAAPTEEERAQPYLWRFWRHIPRRGRITIFDRSWYGRVLVERVEQYCSEADWMRAYGEINDFESQLVRHDILVIKFWLAIGKDEQLRRFKEREQVPFKQFKITQDDRRNRDKWDDYERAVCDMVDRTSTEIAPWTLVEANDKYYARIKILKTLCRQIEDALQGKQ